MDDSALGFIIMVGVLTYFLWTPSRKEVTVYPIKFAPTKSSATCAPNSYPLGRTTYKVFIEQQRVVYWNTGVDEPPELLAVCEGSLPIFD